MSDAPSIKGQSYNSLKEFVCKRFGDQALTKILQQLETSDRELISNMILDIAWKPEQLFINLLNKIEKDLGKGDYVLCREIGSYSAKKGISRFYKIFIRIGDPAFVIEYAGRFWSQIHNHGRLEIRRTSPVSALGTLFEYKTPDKAFCNYLMGYCAGVLEMSGAKDILITETKCVCDGAECCEFSGKWNK